MAGIWNNDPNQNTRPGLYIKFVEAGKQTVTATKSGVVAIPVVNYAGGTAVSGAFYEVSDLATAQGLFGAANVKSIEFALNAGAEKVLAWTLPAMGVAPAPTTEKEQYDLARAAFDTRVFNVFAYDGAVGSAEQDDAIRWVDKSREEGKHFMVVFGGNVAGDDLDPAVGDARSIRLANDYAVNLVSGVVIGGVTYNSFAFAPYIAGLIASTPLNKSITFNKLADVEDLVNRLSYAQTKTSLSKGSLVLTHNGEFVRIEQGITTKSADADSNPIVTKIRKSRVHQVISTDLGKLVETQLIGQVENNDDGYAFAVSMVKLFLEQLEGQGVVSDINVKLDPNFVSSADQLFLAIDFVELDSIDRLFLTITS